MTLHRLTRSAAVAVILAALVTFLPGPRKIQIAEAAGTTHDGRRAYHPAHRSLRVVTG